MATADTTRLPVRATPAFLDMVRQAAMRQGMNAASYIRLALIGKLEKDGFKPRELIDRERKERGR